MNNRARASMRHSKPWLSFLAMTTGLLTMSLAGSSFAAKPKASKSKIKSSVAISSSQIPDSFALGRDSDQEPCTLARTWKDNRISQFDRSYQMMCRGVAAELSSGNIVIIRRGYEKEFLATRESLKSCAESKMVDVSDLGRVEARLCYDQTLGRPVLLTIYGTSDFLYIAEVNPSSQAPLEVAMRTLSGKGKLLIDRYAEATPSFDIKSLPEAPAGTMIVKAADKGDLTFNSQIVLANGIRLNQRGAFVEASRILNGGLSRLTSETELSTRIEYALEAALADSNIRQYADSEGHFATAQDLLSKDDGRRVTDFVYRKQATYLALDAINHLDWPKALEALKPRTDPTKPLLDSSIVSSLNQTSSTSGDKASVTVVARENLSNLFLEAQRNWALSVAHAGLNHIDESRKALDLAKGYVDILQLAVSSDSLISLKARIERQYGRLSAKEDKVEAAINSFDCALDLLQGGTRKNPLGCRFQSSTSLAQASLVSGPIVAETKLERAAILSRKKGISRREIISAYSEAIDASLASSAAGEHPSSDLEPYLDTLVLEIKANPDRVTEDLYFKAIQTIGQPAVARQMAQLQNVVSADKAVGAKVRDRAELERRIVQLRYQIASNDTLEPSVRAQMEQERQIAENRLAVVRSELSSNDRFSLVDDQLVKIDEIQAVLDPGEFYLKVSQLKDSSYAIAISRKKTYIYKLQVDSSTIASLSQKVRLSIRDDSAYIPNFDVKSAYQLFSLVSGPAQSALSKTRALIVDPSGPFKKPTGKRARDRKNVDEAL